MAHEANNLKQFYQSGIPPILVFVLGIFLLITGVPKLLINSTEVPKSPGYLNKALPQAKLQILSSILSNEIDIYAGRHIVIVFSPEDCGTCLQFLTTLNQIYNSEEISIVGIVDTPYWQVLKKLQQLFDLHFPLLQDDAGVIKKFIGQEGKPKVLLLNNGKIEMAATAGLSDNRAPIDAILQAARSSKN